MYTVLDIETTYAGKWNSKESTPSPYHPENSLVAVAYKTNTGEQDFLVFKHVECDNNATDNYKKLQDVLDRSDMVVGHNLKFDMSWLLEAGFIYNNIYFDTMICQYIYNKGLKKSLKLKDVLEEHGLPAKTDILEYYCGELGINVDEVPLSELREYAINDVDTTYELYLKQIAQLKACKLTHGMRPAMKLMNEFLEVLIELERNGVKIDFDALDKVEQEFKIRRDELAESLENHITRVMGHTPINLDSPEQLSWFLYGIKVHDKTEWKEYFNVGTEVRNGVRKKRYPKRIKEPVFREYVRTKSSKLKKTTAHQCDKCGGTGRIQKYNKDGQPSKRLNVCHTCNKTGILYKQRNELAGLGIKPISSIYASEGGFTSGKETIEALLETNLPDDTKIVLKDLKEYSAVSSYLKTFVEGIHNNVIRDILHTNFNQCVTSTGRLSSTKPNLQNQPRLDTFPTRRVFTTRFDGGLLLNADFSQLEFRVAAFLAQDQQAMQDIVDHIDVHTQTADKITENGEPTTRQDAKKSTFRPLYGGTSGTDAQKAYFEFFFERYSGIFNWHKEICESVVAKKYYRTPSGRVYAFPNCTRNDWGGVKFATQIKNYPVQGFATGDILPVTMVRLHQLMKQQKVKSKLILTVHDSIVADCHPEEVDLMIRIFKKAFADTIPLIKIRFGVDFNVPLEYDLDIGKNLLEKTKIELDI